MILISCRLWFPWSYDKCISMRWWQNNRGWGSPWYCDQTLQGVPEGTADMIIMNPGFLLNQGVFSMRLIILAKSSTCSFPSLHCTLPPYFSPSSHSNLSLSLHFPLHPLCPSPFHPPVLSLWVFIPHFGFSVISEQISCQGFNVVGLPNWLFC